MIPDLGHYKDGPLGLGTGVLLTWMGKARSTHLGGRRVDDLLWALLTLLS